ncbi:MAG TPA: tyrosine-type recombinase/integrase [Sphaerochaetaceae bacterium]|nr:tyrosine-type recombinase/integrase [Sphaerochaetaceae bacterium]
MEATNSVQVESYLGYIQDIRRLSEFTVICYRHDLTQFLSFLQKRDLDIFEVTAMDARRFIAELLGNRNMKSPTVNRMLSTLRGFYRYAMRQGAISMNPFSRIEGSPRYRRLPSVLSRRQIVSILSVPVSTFTDLRNSVMFHLFYATGCRLSELLNANVEDLELDQERMLVRGKGNRQRYVFINVPTRALVVRYLEQRQQFLLEKGTSGEEDSHALLVGNRGRRLSASSVHSIFEKYRLKLGLQTRFTPHMLRHSFATHMLDNESGIRIVQQLLGHASISTTQIYTHVSQERLRAVYEKSHPHGRKKHGN